MYIKKLKTLLKSWILVILFYNFYSCGKEGTPHPPLPKEKVVKEISILQIGENIYIEINIPEKFLGGNLEVFFIKAKNPQKKEMPLPPPEAVFKKNNLIFKENIKEKSFKKFFKKDEMKIEYNFSTFWGFFFEKGNEKEKTKIFHFLFLEPSEKPLINSFKKVKEGIEFYLEKPENCRDILVKKEINGGLPQTISLKKEEEGIFIDENVKDNSFYRYIFYCWDIDEKHLSEATFIETLYKYEFKPSPPEEVSFLEEKDSIRIEFKKVSGAIKYKVYEKCAGDENWKFIGETDKNFFSTEKKLCVYGVSSVNEAGLESDILEAKEY